MGVLGRVVFGAAAVLFGVVALMWHDAQTWQSMYRILALPFGMTIGGVLMIAQIAGGLALPFPRTMRAASIVLGVVYALFALTCIAGIVAAPSEYGVYESFCEPFSLVCGAIAVYTMTEPNASTAAVLARAARLGLGLCAASFTISQIVYFHLTAGLVPAWIPPNQNFWAALTTIAFGLAAVAMLIDRYAQLAMRLMSVMLGLFGLLVWVPLLIGNPQRHFNWSEFALNYLIAGAAWTVSEVAARKRLLAPGASLGTQVSV